MDADRLTTLVCAAALFMSTGGCRGDGGTLCTTLGRGGGVLQSHDSVLTIAIQPEALDEDREFCISRSGDPPEVFGDAYIVGPPTQLYYDAVVSYRGELPEDLSDVNIGRITDRLFAKGRGTWTSLPGCRVDAAVRNVQCVDDQLSKFYGLLDQVLVPGDDDADESSGDSSDPAPESESSGEEAGTDTGTDLPPQPVDYPPECDDLFRGPYSVVHAGLRFEPEGAAGSEDMAADGHGGFVARRGAAFARLDVTGGTLGTPNDPGFSVREVVDTPVLAVPTLGLRYAASGDLLLTSFAESRLRGMRADGSTYTILDDLAGPNGLHIDIEGAAWYSESIDGRVVLFDLEAKDPTPQVTALLDVVSGILHDPLRRQLFYASALDGQLWRVPTAGSSLGSEPVLVAAVGGEIHGLAMDVCGNLYAVDSAADVRLVRLFMDELGDLIEIEEIAVDIDSEPTSAVFGVGEAYGAFRTALFMLGPTGELEYVDLQIGGAAIPGRDSPAPTVHVANGNFEQEPLLPDVYVFAGPPARWQVYDPGLVIDGNVHTVGWINTQGSELYPGGAPDGDHAALVFLWSDDQQFAGLSQLLHTRLTAATDYTLRVHIGNPAEPTDAPFSFVGFPGYRIELLAGSTVLVADDSTLLPPEGEFLESVIHYAATGDEPETGQRLEVRLINLDATAGLEIEFDGVTLEVADH